MSANVDQLLKWTTSLGVGLLPGAPGTYGSALTALAATAWLGLGGGALAGPCYWATLVVLVLLALPFTGAALARGVFGPDDDPSSIVIDEAAGMLLAMWGLGQLDWRLPAAFAAFRLFDIVKPPPVNWSQSLPGAWGVVVDDLLAGAYALGLLRLIQWALADWGF